MAKKRRKRQAEPEKKNDLTQWIIRGVVVLILAIAAWKIVPPYLQAQKAKPKWDEGVQAFQARKLDQAIALLNEAKELAPDWKQLQQDYPGQMSQVQWAKAEQLQEAGKYKAAVPHYREALELNPDLGAQGLHYALAECYNRQQKYKQALMEVKKQIEAGGDKAKLAKGMREVLKKKLAANP